MNNHFYALVIVCLCGHTFEDDNFNDIMTPEDYECMAELGLDKKEVATFFDQNLLMTLKNPLSDSYTECWFRTSNVLTDKNEFNFEKFGDYIIRYGLGPLGKQDVKNVESLVHEAVDSCKNVEGSNIGNRGAKIYNCIVKAILNF
ncbi:hypothetical protein RI129_001883 [Pyrocoelia pectoralis]|uniref:Uncharacterized protein n=1 Tax=Pyrocoelia pectoralis TaxID=417401 RepID=A0AAN7W0P7_9COLE